MSKEIDQWTHYIEHIALPRYESLPDIGLYIDQVITYVTGEIQNIFKLSHPNGEDILTPSMINNYVKNKIMTPPVKKKYKKSHIAFIFTITILKQVGSLNDVSFGIKNLTHKLGAKDAFNTFIQFLESALKASALELSHTPDASYYMKPVDIDLLPLKTATIAFTSIMMTRYLFSQQQKNNKEL